MWFRSVYLKSLRESRVAMLGWGLGLGLLVYAVLNAFPALVETPEARASLVTLSSSFAWLAQPIAVDTPGGYATFKYGFTILLLAIWPLLVGARMLRGEEERGSMDVLLSLPRGRGRIAVEKLAAMWTALLGMGLLIALLTYAGGNQVHAGFGFKGAALFALNVILASGLFGSIALFLAQFTQERGTAASITGGLLLIFIVLDMIHRVIPNTDWISSISPIYYYNLNKPLISSMSIDIGAFLVLVGLNIVLSAAAILLFARRDIGAGVGWLRLPERQISPSKALPVNDWSLRSIYARSLRTVLVPTFWWTLGIAGFAAWMVAIVKQTENSLSTIYKSSPLLSGVITKLGGSDTATNASFLSALFTILPLLLMAFAITQASRWSADEEDGLQDMILANPQSRLRVILARFGALTTVTIIIGLITLGATYLAATGTGLALDTGNLVAATLSIIPLGLLMAALGYLLSGWLNTAIDTGLLSFILVIWFFISFVGPETNLPDAALHLSAFYYYGTPLLHGLPVGDTLFLIGLTLLALVLATVRFVRKDIGR